MLYAQSTFKLAARKEKSALNIKQLNPDASPRAAFGAELRRVREELGMTQDQVAERTGYSSGHISSLETGRKSPTLRLARKVDRAFGTGSKFENLFFDLRASSLLQGFGDYMAHEARAVELRLFDLGIVPGLLQTPEYAEAITRGAVRRGSITQVQANERLEVLASRQAKLFRQPPPLLFAVLDESCLWRPVGGPEVMGAQLDRLVEVSELPNVTIQVAPYAMAEARAFDLPIYLLTLPGHSVAAYSESSQRGHFEHDPDAVRPLLTDYHHLQVEALSQAASVALIRKAREELQ
ncbi:MULTISPECIES: helix-turn-helix domain-containing protein [Kitasatospora]|uniref:helix-turn-helix domain-containing protein n=1 Tax=Kitasatospora TaxID=2063 RepID=UPI002475499D|nr:helix-turn-helix transcriptional regulator [Kitasatospora sp. GP30]MDH6138086.1 transcriptional regulator with XRE-family HTH domain [Kitasatospora sp. GP30]